MQQQQQDNSSKPTSTVDQLKAARLARRADAAREYHTLLLRNEDPRAGDADALTEVMRVLGRTEDDLAGDVAVVRALAASEDAERQSRKLDKPWEKARQTFKETKARVERERAEFEKRVTEELQAAGAAFNKLTAERQALQYASEQAPRDEWAAIVEGISVEEARAARRAARRRTAPTPAPVTREGVLARCREDMVVHRLAPGSGTAVDKVNAELHVAGFDPLTDAEIQKHEIETWAEPRRRF